MTIADSLYSELKPEISLLANELFDLSEQFLRKRGNFLPHGAVLTEDGELKLVAAAPDSPNDVTDSTEVLPVLHDGLRQMAKESPLAATAVAENVTITLEGKRPTGAIKVLIEHKRGLAVALYLPFEKKFLRGFTMGVPFTLSASPEVNAWPQAGA
jgi:hypothetical protein